MDLQFISFDKNHANNNNNNETKINIITKKNIAISKTFYKNFYHKQTVGLLYLSNNPFDCHCSQLLDYNFSLKMILFKLFLFFLIIVVCGFFTPIYIAITDGYKPCYGASIVSFLMCIVFVLFYNYPCCNIDKCCFGIGNNSNTDDLKRKINLRRRYNVDVVYNVKVQDAEKIIKVFNDDDCQWYKNDICSHGYDYECLIATSRLVLQNKGWNHGTQTVGET